MPEECGQSLVPGQVSRWRSDVAERFINLEGVIMATVCRHCFGRLAEPLGLEVLHDEQCPLALKGSVLKKTIQDSASEKLQDLCRPNRIRIVFAHCGLKLVGVPDPSSGARFVPDPRHVERELDS